MAATTKEITNDEDVIDSRDVIARIADLESNLSAAYNETDEPRPAFAAWLYVAMTETNHPNYDEAKEYNDLLALQTEAEGYAADWRHGEALIRETYFKEYAEQLAEDIGAINRDATWPNNCIDWDRAARELQFDYTSVDFAGVTYFIR